MEEEKGKARRGEMTRKRMMRGMTMQGELFPCKTLKIQKNNIQQIQNYFKCLIKGENILYFQQIP